MSHGRRHRRWLRRVGIGLSVLALAYVSLLLAFQRDLVFPRHWVKASGMPAEVGLRRLSLRSGAEAWFAVADGVAPDKPGPLVIYAHGNGEVIDGCGARMQWYRDRGFSVLLVEYRGYGRSPGSPSEDGIATDFVEAHDLAVALPEVDPHRVAYHGFSLGGGVACSLARQRPPNAMILQSTFTSIPDAAPWWAVSALSVDPFDNLECMSEYQGPVLILHGREDTLIPVHHAQRLHAAAASSKLVLHDAGHTEAPPEGWRVIAAFLAANL